MGTSTSFRAPAVPRWQAFTTALTTDQPLERVVAELFNAGNEWEEALASTAIAAYADALGEAPARLAELLGEGERPHEAIQRYAEEVKHSSLGPTPALALAERAFKTLLTESLASGTSLSRLSSDAAAENVAASAQLGASPHAKYLAELLGQYTRHVVAREAGRLTEGVEGRSVATARETMLELARAAESIGHRVAAEAEEPATREAWPSLVRKAFNAGRTIRPNDL